MVSEDDRPAYQQMANNMGVFKSRELGRQPWDADFGNMSDETKAWIGEILRAEGCKGYHIL